MKRLIPLAIALAGLPGAAFAQVDAPRCGTLDQALPAELRTWLTPGRHTVQISGTDAVMVRLLALPR